MAEINEECADYFRQRPGLHRVMKELLRCYRRYGCAKGRIFLEDATEEERDALDGLFAKQFPPTVKLGAADVEAVLKRSAYRDADLKRVVELYFDTVISTNRQRRQEKAEAMEDLLAQAGQGSRGGVSGNFLEAMAAKQFGRGYALLARELENSPDTVRKELKLALGAMDTLEAYEGPPVRLAVFSAQATRDPHALDSERFAGKVFVHMLALRMGRPYPKGAEERDILYFDNGILCDSISSTVTQLGLILRTDEGAHPAFEAFRTRGECATLSLTNLARLTGAESPTGKAYLVENQMVFSQLCDGAGNFRSPVICTSGQVQVAVLRLLDLLAASGTELYYAGDFDGGGLTIALRLMNRYKNLKLWHMEPEDYTACMSDVQLTDSSLSMLKQTEGTPLEPLAAALRASGCAGYQELLLERMLKELTS